MCVCVGERYLNTLDKSICWIEAEMDDKVLSFVNMRLLTDSISKHGTQVNFRLSASRISNIFHLYRLGTKSMTLSWHLRDNLSHSARPAPWHFCLTHFCPGTWCWMFHRRPGISSVCQPVVASDKDNFIDYTDWHTTKGKADTVSACCVCAHTCTLCVCILI